MVWGLEVVPTHLGKLAMGLYHPLTLSLKKNLYTTWWFDVHSEIITNVVEEQTYLYPEAASGWSNNQIGMREIRKRKSADFIHTQGNLAHRSHRPHLQERLEDRRCPELGLRSGALGAWAEQRITDCQCALPYRWSSRPGADDLWLWLRALIQLLR